MGTYTQRRKQMFDKVVVSTDENPDFIDFIPIVSTAWKKFFPEAELAIAFVTDRDEEDETVQKMRQYGDVGLFATVPDVPTSNQAKICRHLMAARQGSSVCMLEDVDTIPLQRAFFEERTSSHEAGKILAVGREVYGNTQGYNNFPMSTATATGNVFREIFGDKEDSEIVSSFVGKIKYFDKEDISQPYPHFSDEYLLRVLIEEGAGDVIHIRRGVDVRTQWIDRSFWSVDIDKLNAGQYVTCNFLRNMRDQFSEIKPIADYIYGKSVDIEDVTL